MRQMQEYIIEWNSKATNARMISITDALGKPRMHEFYFIDA